MGNSNAGVFRALGALLLLGTCASASAQFAPDANTVGLWHFDAQTAQGLTPDSGSNGFDGVVQGAVLPTHQASIIEGYGFAYEFDGVDRGDGSNGRIQIGTPTALGYRGRGDWTLELVVSVTQPLTDDAYFRGIVCRASSQGIDYSLSYTSWTHPTAGPEHEFWFTTGPATGAEPDYASVATYFNGLMEVGMSYAIRVTSQGGILSMTVNGFDGTSMYWPGDAVPATAAPISADLTVGDSCYEDYVVKPSELQVDELRISDIARTDPQDLTGLIPAVLTQAGVPLPDSQAALAYRRERLALAVQLEQARSLLAAPAPAGAGLKPKTGLVPLR